MEITSVSEILPYLAMSAVGGFGYLVKHYINKRDEEDKRKEAERKAEEERRFAERDRDKAEMKQDIAELKREVTETKKEVRDMQAMIVGCEHDDCPNRPLLKEYMMRKRIE